MRFARKMLLLAIAAVAAMAFAAAPASATNAIEVVDESTASHCSAVTPVPDDPTDPEDNDNHTDGGCAVHAEGTITLERWIFAWGVERTCDIELDMRVGEDGTGAVDSLDHYTTEPTAESDCETNPPVVMCEAPWEGSGERVSSTTIHAKTAVCIDPTEVDACGSTMEYDIVENAQEGLSVVFANSNIGSICRINGTLAAEGNVPHIN